MAVFQGSKSELLDLLQAAARRFQGHTNSRLETGVPTPENQDVRWKKITLVGIGWC